MTPPNRAVPPWSTVPDAVKLILRGVTFPTASRVALVVGTLLSLVNQGSVIINRNATLVTAVRVAINYVVPFTVASIGYLSPFRQQSTASPDKTNAADNVSEQHRTPQDNAPHASPPI